MRYHLRELLGTSNLETVLLMNTVGGCLLLPVPPPHYSDWPTRVQHLLHHCHSSECSREEWKCHSQCDYCYSRYAYECNFKGTYTMTLLGVIAPYI